MADQLTLEAITEGLVNLLDDAEIVAAGQEINIEFPEADGTTVRITVTGEDRRQHSLAIQMDDPLGSLGEPSGAYIDAHAEGVRTGHAHGVPLGMRAAAAYIDRVGRLLGSNEQRLRYAQAPDFLRRLARAVENGDVRLPELEPVEVHRG
jgi:hypothetical protein